MTPAARFALIVAACSILLSSCSIHSTKGFYEGSAVGNWSHSVPSGTGGVNYYQPKPKTSAGISVTVSTTQRGTIWLAVHSYTDRLPVFFAPEMQIDLDHGGKLAVPTGKYVSITVGPTETFTVHLPAFQLAGHRLPALDASFKWNPETRYKVSGIQ